MNTDEAVSRWRDPQNFKWVTIQRTKKWKKLVSALWFAGRASEFVDDLTRTLDERHSFCVR